MSIPSDEAPLATSVADLRAGDMVQAQHLHGPQTYRGEVDAVLPEMGLLWIRHGALQTRKLLEASEYRICRWPAPQARQSH